MNTRFVVPLLLKQEQRGATTVIPPAQQGSLLVQYGMELFWFFYNDPMILWADQ